MNASISMRTPGTASKLLSLYLRDHLAGAAGGVALFRRAAAGAVEDEHRELLERLAQDVADNTTQLRRIAGALGIRRPRLKEFAAVAAERVARGKLNGRLFRRSPLSAVVETEAMILGVTGQMLAWKSLAARELGDAIPLDADLSVLEARAIEQRIELEKLHQDLVRQIFASRRSGARSA